MKLKLLKEHRHDGRDLVPGQTLTLDPANPQDKYLADWLVEKKVAEPLPEPAKAAKAEKPVPAQG